MESSSTKLPSGPAPSNGCAEFTLKNPPPFVPSCLIAIWDATGPRAIVWSNPWMPCATAEPENVCTTPCVMSTTATITASGSRM